MPQSVASFDPKLIEALRVGSRQVVRIDLTSFAQAQRLRFRFHGVKAALRREKNPISIITDKTHIKISGQREPAAWLEIRPADSEFADVLQAALPAPTTVEPTSTISSEVATEKMVSDLAGSIRDVLGKDE